MNAMQIRLANVLYRKGNNDGRGFAPDEPEVEAAVAALVAEGWTLEHRAADTSDVSVLSSSGEWVAIGGDARGMQSWAVRIYTDKLAATWRRASREAGDTDMIAICDDAALAHVRAAQLAVMRAEAEA